MCCNSFGVWGCFWSAVFEPIGIKCFTQLDAVRVSKFGSLSGFLTAFNIGLMGQALQFGDASTIVPLTNCSFVLTTILSICLGMEEIDKYKVTALVVACCAIMMLAFDPG